MFPRSRVAALLSVVAVLIPAALHAADLPVEEGRVSFAFAPGRLAELGLTVTGPARTVSPDPREETGLEGDVQAFALETADLEVSLRAGHFASFQGERTVVLAARGGFSLRAEHPRTGAALAPAMLYDFRVELTAGSDRPVRIASSDPRLPDPFVVRGRGLGLDARRRAIAVSMADILVSESWAAAMKRPEMAGQWLGSLDVSLASAGLAEYDTPAPEDHARQAMGADVELSELYGVLAIGRDVPYPNGSAAFSAATTSCNPGTVEVEWELGTADTLKENHPFIGLAVYRESASGALEMIARNWIKHGFFATSNDDCNYGCNAVPNGTRLGIGCSDTYTVGHNGSRLYLGPREEVNPHTAAWSACGSFFDATPSDCFRDYFGSEFSEVAHRLEVFDEDMEHPGARYFYEGVYYVKDDTDLSNNIGWREFTATWAGLWVLVTVPNDPVWTKKDFDGALISTWGDQQNQMSVASDDGLVWLAVKTDSLGGGQWHYEYAVYNYTSDRGLRSFSVPTGNATLTNVGFHDVDKDSLNDWSATVTPGLVTWETDDFATDPNANALTYGSMFNFRFDADVPPVGTQVRAGIFKPGVGTELFSGLQGPATGATSALVTEPADPAFGLRGVEPNPFRQDTRVQFASERERQARISVVDIAGREIRVLLDGRVPAGRSEAVWDGKDTAGARAAAGIYFFRMESEGASDTLKGIFIP